MVKLLFGTPYQVILSLIKMYGGSKLNESFNNIFMKAPTIRVNSVADHIVSPTQPAFMGRCNILHGVVSYMKPYMSYIEKSRVGLHFYPEIIFHPDSFAHIGRDAPPKRQVL